MEERDNRFWYDHTYQGFIRRIKGINSLKDNGLFTKEQEEEGLYIILINKAIKEFFERTDLQLDVKELERLAEEIKEDLTKI